MSKPRIDFDVVVVGAGPAGIAAACVAAESGRRVVLIESTPWIGGPVWRSGPRAKRSAAAHHWLSRLQSSSVQVLSQTAVVAAPRPKVLLVESPGKATAVAFERLILAVGARELFLPFPGWTLPNVVGPGGLQLLVKSGWPVAGQRILVAGTGPLLLAAAAHLRAAGAKIVLVAEQAPGRALIRFGLALPTLAPSKMLQGAAYQLKLLGVPYRAGCWPVAAVGTTCVEGVTLRTRDRSWTEACDYLACGFGLVPNLELPQLLGCRIENGAVWTDDDQQTSVAGVYCAGESTGIGGVDQALVEGQIAGALASGPPEAARRLTPVRQRARKFARALDRAFALRPELKSLAQADTIVCRCEDIPRRQLELYDGWRAAKLHTRCGMGPCQGRVCGAAVRVLFGWKPESVRPPVLPVRVKTLMEIELETETPVVHAATGNQQPYPSTTNQTSP